MSVRPGLRMDFEEIFIDDEVEEDEEKREVKQMKSSPVLLPLLLLWWARSESITLPHISHIHPPTIKDGFFYWVKITEIALNQCREVDKASCFFLYLLYKCIRRWESGV